MQPAGRLTLPPHTQAVLWDMDGVLVDSLKLALSASNRLLAEHFGPEVQVDSAFVRSIFAYHTPEFWRRIVERVAAEYQLPAAAEAGPALQVAYDNARLAAAFELNPGIAEILQALQAAPLKTAVVSNNPTEEVKTNLRRAGILDYFDAVVGNDIEKLEKKPAPDTYLFAAKTLGVEPEHCVVVEDSLIGAEAGRRADCYVVGVATGGSDFEPLSRSTHTDVVYQAFTPPALNLRFGEVRDKRLVTPNEFVSHMVEHIAWRLGTSIHLHWPNDDWYALGHYLGETLRVFPAQGTSSAALGMIDDGSAEVAITLSEDIPGLDLSGIANLDLDWFVGLRCEQLNDGVPLTALMAGLAEALGIRLAVRVCNVEDPHHTWEGVFRAIGIALSRLYTPQADAPPKQHHIERQPAEGELQIRARSLYYAEVFRGTAESHVAVAVDFTRAHPHRFVFNVAPAIDVSGLPALLSRFAEAAGFSVQVDFNATVLSSSHVVLEDTALVLGRALLEILNLRMQQWGVNGAGGSVHTPADFEQQTVRVGLSVEGRKFWRFVPFQNSTQDLRRQFLLGRTGADGLRSEDLDDFIDGFSGGLACSIMIHLAELPAPEAGWQELFGHLGMALREAFAPNPYRKGVPPGVKATLA